MARTLYGGSPADVIAQVSVDDGDYAPATATLTAWDSLTGGTQLTDLLTAGGGVIASVTPDSVGRVLFQGPDGYTAAIWLEDTGGTRWRIDPADLAERAGASSTTGTVESVNGIDPDGSGNVALDADDIGDGTTGKQFTATEKSKLAGIATDATANDADANLKNRANHTGTEPLTAMPIEVPYALFYAGGAADRKTTSTSRVVIWVCTTTARPPEVTSGTGGSYPDDLVVGPV